MKDYYGDGIKWFIGVVEDTQDPKGTNRVRVRINGIHTDIGKVASVEPSSGTPAPSSSAPGSGPTQPAGGSGNIAADIGAGGSSPSVPPINVDPSSLPNASQLSKKISKYFTLADLTVGVTGSNGKRTSLQGIHDGKLTQQIIQNLASLSQNVLDPIRDHFGNLEITSGWRIGYSSADNDASGGNHPKGIAADIKVAGTRAGVLGIWIWQNLKGRFVFMQTYAILGHLHIQNQGTPNQGSLAAPHWAGPGTLQPGRSS